MALSADIKVVRYGTPGNSTQKNNLPGTANATIYRGSIAITRAGYLVAATTPQSTDTCWGVIQGVGPGFADTGPGIVCGTTNGATTIDVATGSFFVAAGSGADAITQAQAGATVYVINETTVGATNGGGTRPVAGVVSKVSDGLNVLAGFVAVHLGSAQSSGGPS